MLYNYFMLATLPETRADELQFKNITTYYEGFEGDGEAVGKYIQEILQNRETGRTMPHECAFYLNSSDSLDLLLAQNFKNKRVFTVSGSGEFSQIFALNGANEVCSFDISPAAAFYAEMRYQGLCTLPFVDYTRMFNEWTPKPSSSLKPPQQPLFNLEVYQNLRSNLSPEARGFFDSVTDVPKLFYYDNHTMSGFARRRIHQTRAYNRLVGDIITTEGDYLDLQDRARNTNFTQMILDGSRADGAVRYFSPDTAYITNVGYEPQRTIGMANHLLELGVSEVYMTISTQEDTFKRDLPTGISVFWYRGSPLERGSKFSYELYQGLPRGSEVAVNIEVAGIDPDADFGLLLRAYK